MKNVQRLSIVLLLLLCLIGCNANQAITNLELVLASVETVFPLVAGVAGVPPAVVQQVSTYLAAVSSASGQASTILEGTGTAAQKAAQITSLFAGVTKPLLPPGTAQNVVSAVDAVAQAVAKFLANFAGANLKTASTKVVTPTPADAKRLQAIRVRAQSDADKAKALK